VIVRRARLDEAAAAADVWVRSRVASVPAIPPPTHTEADMRAHFAEVVVPSTEVWVAESGGALLAVLVLDGEWVDQLYVDPDHFGQGIGGALLATAKRERPSGLRLSVFVTNVGARRFYERHGFVPTGPPSTANEEQVPAFEYAWRP
jgi:GNAT superfamily N-acetyltransferase